MGVSFILFLCFFLVGFFCMGDIVHLGKIQLNIKLISDACVDEKAMNWLLDESKGRLMSLLLFLAMMCFMHHHESVFCFHLVGSDVWEDTPPRTYVMQARCQKRSSAFCILVGGLAKIRTTLVRKIVDTPLLSFGFQEHLITSHLQFLSPILAIYNVGSYPKCCMEGSY